MRRLLVVLVLVAMPFSGAVAQAPQQGTAPPAAQQSISSSLDMYAFPKDGQSSEQQSKDESACYSWASTNTGVDPFNTQKQAAQDQQQSQQEMQKAASAGAGAGAAGAVGGAAAGALIGSLAHNDVGNSAGWGAAIGLVAARRRAHEKSEQAQQQVAAQSAQQQQASATQMTNFKNAFSACLEGKNYLVKY